MALVGSATTLAASLLAGPLCTEVQPASNAVTNESSNSRNFMFCAPPWSLWPTMETQKEDPAEPSGGQPTHFRFPVPKSKY
jgi:hypothetical protein